MTVKTAKGMPTVGVREKKPRVNLPSIPGGTFDPIDGGEKGGRSAVTSILKIDAFDVGITGRGENAHQNRLCGFALI